jgi:hypothetical protein
MTYEVLLDSDKVLGLSSGGSRVPACIHRRGLGHAELFSEEDRDKLQHRWTSLWRWVAGEISTWELIN